MKKDNSAKFKLEKNIKCKNCGKDMDVFSTTFFGSSHIVSRRLSDYIAMKRTYGPMGPNFERLNICSNNKKFIEKTNRTTSKIRTLNQYLWFECWECRNYYEKNCKLTNTFTEKYKKYKASKIKYHKKLKDER